MKILLVNLVHLEVILTMSGADKDLEFRKILNWFAKILVKGRHVSFVFSLRFKLALLFRITFDRCEKLAR